MFFKRHIVSCGCRVFVLYMDIELVILLIFYIAYIDLSCSPVVVARLFIVGKVPEPCIYSVTI